MNKKIILDNYELEERLNGFCKGNNLCKELFEIARSSKGYGITEIKVLDEPSNVRNRNCTYVIKMLPKYYLIIILEYKNNPSMSYSYITIQNKLNKGVFYADKVIVSHTNNLFVILFEYT